MPEIPCPSGLVIECKALHGAEIIALAERITPNTTGDFWATILSGVHTRTLDPGPYKFVHEGDTKPPFERIAWADLMTALIRVRVETFKENEQLMHGVAYDFEYSCQYCKRLSSGS
jgi:hypothetical protein